VGLLSDRRPEVDGYLRINSFDQAEASFGEFNPRD